MNQIYGDPGRGLQFIPFWRHLVLRVCLASLLSVFFYADTFAYPYPTIEMKRFGTAYLEPVSSASSVSVFNNLILEGSLYFLTPSCQLVGPPRTCESTDRVVFIGTADMVGMNPTYQFTLNSNTANAVISGPSSGSYNGPVQLALIPGPSFAAFTVNGSVTVTFIVSGPGGTVLSTCTQTFTIDPLPVANGAGLSACAVSGTKAVFNLTSLAATITGGAGNTIEWFSNASLTTSISNPAAYTSGNGVVYAKVESPTTGCCNVAPISLAVVQAPDCIIARPTPTEICANTPGLIFTAPADHARYEWTVTGGTITAGLNTNQITVTAGGAGTLVVSFNVTNNNNCTSTCSVQFSINPMPVCEITGNNTICEGQSTSFTATGGSSYSWTGPGAFTASIATINNLTVSGTYTVTVTNAAGCTSSCSRTLIVNPVPVCEITGANSICAGLTTTFTATGGTSYSWTGPGGFTASTASINIGTAGTYTVIVTNASGCTSTCSRTLTLNPGPVCNITGVNEICAGQSTTFIATGGVGYSWTGPGGFTANTAIISNLTVPGTYLVIITNEFNCSVGCSRTLTVNPLPVCTITGNNNICTGQAASFTATGGTSYSWTGPGGFTASTATISNLRVAGTYTVTVTNAAGCTSTCSRTLTVNALPVCEITGNNSICTGQAASFTAAGGTSYSWTGPGEFTASTATISNLTVAGTYTVTVSNGSGCTSTCSRTLTVGQGTCEITGNNNICAGLTTTFTATGGTSYSWTGPGGFTASTASINIGTAGTYTVIVTNASGCTSTCSRTLTLNPGPVCNITGVNEICAGQSTTFIATGGVGYSWTGPGGFTANTAIISNLTVPGTYLVIITNEFNCSVGCSRTLTVNPLPVCAITGNNIICTGQAASFTATGGTSYSWTGPGGFTASTATISNLRVAGTYTVTVTNAAGCTSTCSRTLTVGQGTCEITGNNNICAGLTTTFTATGGTSYSWTGPGGFTASTASINIGTAGTYTVIVTNASGCTSTCSRTLTLNPGPVCNITGVNEICAGQSTTFIATGGVGYSWTGPGGFTANTAIISNLTVPGTYLVIITNEFNCSVGCSRTLTVNPLPVCTITGNNNICTGQAASFTAAGGTSYSWTGPGGFTASTATISNLTVAGTYTITVSNGSGCTSTCSRTLTAGQGTCEITGNNNICAGATTMFTASGGTSYSWTGPGAFISNGASIIVSTPGTYTVTVSDGSGCTSTCSRTLTVNPAPTCAITGVNVIQEGQSTTFTASGGTSYSWTGPGAFASNGASIIVSTPGTYTVTVTNAGGCTSTCSRVLTVQQGGPSPCLITGPPNACPGQTGLVFNVPAVYTSYVWSVTGGTITSGTGTNSITVTAAGAGNIVVSFTGMTALVEIVMCTLTVPVAALAPCILNVPTTLPACGSNNNSLTGPAGYTNYVWTVSGNGTYVSGNGNNTLIYNAGASGTITINLTATAASGCATTCTVSFNCGPISACSRSQGYYKNHPEVWDAMSDFIVAGGTVGGITYPGMPVGLRFITSTDFYTYYNIPAGSIDRIPAGTSMHDAGATGGGGCINLARQGNAALLNAAAFGNAYLGQTSYSSFVELYNAIRAAFLSGNCGGLATQLDGFNNSGDNGCSDLPGGARGLVSTSLPAERQLSVTSYPNPFTDRVNFSVQSKVAGIGTLEVFGLMGEKIKTIFKGYIEKDDVRTFTLDVPVNMRKTMIYQFRIGDQVVTGKLVYPN